MLSVFAHYKAAEKLLQERVETLGFHARVEPIAALDLFYSDGLVGGCNGKVIFTNKEKIHNEYAVFFPFYCMNLALPPGLKAEFDAWSKHLDSIVGKE